MGWGGGGGIQIFLMNVAAFLVSVSMLPGNGSCAPFQITVTMCCDVLWEDMILCSMLLLCSLSLLPFVCVPSYVPCTSAVFHVICSVLPVLTVDGLHVTVVVYMFLCFITSMSLFLSYCECSTSPLLCSLLLLPCSISVAMFQLCFHVPSVFVMFHMCVASLCCCVPHHHCNVPHHSGYVPCDCIFVPSVGLHGAAGVVHVFHVSCHVPALCCHVPHHSCHVPHHLTCSTSLAMFQLCWPCFTPLAMFQLSSLLS